MATKRNNEGVKVEPLRHSDALYGVMEEANLYRIIESDGDYREMRQGVTTTKIACKTSPTSGR